MSLGDDLFRSVAHDLNQKVDALDEKLDALQKDITQIGKFEERLLTFRETAARIGEEVKELRRDMEARIRLLEAHAPISRLTSNWILMAVIGIVAAIGGAVISRLIGH